MPSVSKKQRNFMAAAAHNPEFAKKAGVPVSVAKEFNAADKGKKFKSGGNMADKSKLKKLFKGKDTYKEELKEAKAIKSGKITPKEYAKGEKMEGIHGLKRGGKTQVKTKCMATGGAVNVGGKALPKAMGSLGLKDGGDAAAKVKQYNAGKDAFSNAKLQAEMVEKARKDKAMQPKPETTVEKTYKLPPKTVVGEDIDAPPYSKGGCCKMARGGLAKANGKAIRGKTKGRFI